MIVLQTIPITSEVPYFEIPSNEACGGEFLVGVDLKDKFPEEYYTFQQDLDQCPTDQCEREKCPGSDESEVFKIFKVDTNDGFKLIPELENQRLVYADEIAKDEGTK